MRAVWAVAIVVVGTSIPVSGGLLMVHLLGRRSLRWRRRRRPSRASRRRRSGLTPSRGPDHLAKYAAPKGGVSCMAGDGRRVPDGGLLRNYSLSITLALLFFVSWFARLVTQWFNWANEQREHNQPLEVGDFLWQFWTSTLENWQSEFLQLLTLVVLTSFLIHRTSPESRDSDDELQKTLNRIEKRLKALEGEGGRTKAGSS